MIKKLLIAVAVLVVVIIAAAVILPFLIPTDTIKQELQAQVKEATGRDLAIDGAFEFTLLPEAVLKAGNVRFQNGPGGSRADMVTLKELRVHVALLPLLSSEIEVKEFVLEGPDILLEMDKDGRPNWAFATAAKTDRREGGPGSDGDGPKAVRLGDVRIVGGRLEYRDAQSGTTEVLENLNLALQLPSLDEPFAARGSATWHGEPLEVQVDLREPRAMLTQEATAVAVKLSGRPLTLGYDGTLDPGKGSVAGRLNLDVASVRGLAAWVGSPLAVQGDDVLNALKLNGQVAASAAGVTLAGATMTLDRINSSGDLTVALGGKVPTITGKLTMEALDLNPYLAAFGGEAGKAGGGSGSSQGWSEEPIDVSALRAVNADLDLTVGSLQAQDIKIGKSRVQVQLQGGKLDLNLSEMALYDGNGTLQLAVDASGPTPVIKSTVALSGLQAEPFLTDAAKLEWLSGRAAMDMSITTRGTSQKALANALNGAGKMAFTDGAVRGTNLAALLRGLATLQLDPASWETAKTDFAELAGTFTIKDGILSNNDLTLQSQLLRVGGQGTVGIGARTIDYKAEPKAVASLQGQGGAADIGGLPIGVRVHGSWDNPQTDYSLGGDNLLALAQDPQALVSRLSNLGAITDPQSLADQLGKLGGADSGMLEALKGLGGGGSPATDALKGLLPGGDASGSGGSGSGSAPIDALKQLLPGGGSGSGSGTDGGTTGGSGTQPTMPNPADAVKKLFGR